jgi:hypothetical protein
MEIAILPLPSSRRSLPDPGGEIVFVTPMSVPQSINSWGFVRAGYLIDLIAWDPSALDCWVLRVGAAGWFGCTEVQDYPNWSSQ